MKKRGWPWAWHYKQKWQIWVGEQCSQLSSLRSFLFHGLVPGTVDTDPNQSKTGLAGSITYLMTPEPLQIIGPFNDIRRGQQSALYNTSEVSQVEQIVGFRGCGQEICHGILVHFQSAVYQHFTDSKVFLCKAPGIERKCIIQLFTCSFKNIWLAKDVL